MMCSFDALCFLNPANFVANTMAAKGIGVLLDICLHIIVATDNPSPLAIANPG